jgi:hypothetical protein
MQGGYNVARMVYRRAETCWTECGDGQGCIHGRSRSPSGWDPSAESDKTVVSICIDLKQFVCLEPTHPVSSVPQSEHYTLYSPTVLTHCTHYALCTHPVRSVPQSEHYTLYSHTVLTRHYALTQYVVSHSPSTMHCTHTLYSLCTVLTHCTHYALCTHPVRSVPQSEHYTLYSHTVLTMHYALTQYVVSHSPSTMHCTHTLYSRFTNPKHSKKCPTVRALYTLLTHCTHYALFTHPVRSVP